MGRHHDSDLRRDLYHLVNIRHLSFPFAPSRSLRHDLIRFGNLTTTGELKGLDNSNSAVQCTGIS